MLCQANYLPEGTESPPLPELPLPLATSVASNKDLNPTHRTQAELGAMEFDQASSNDTFLIS